LRAIYRRALDLDQLAVNPTLKLRLPAVRGNENESREPTKPRRARPPPVGKIERRDCSAD